MGKNRKRTDKLFFFCPLILLFAAFFLIYLITLFNFHPLFKVSIPFISNVTLPAQLVLPFSPSASSSSSSFGRSCSTCRASPLAFSSHPTSNQINSLFHSQGYDKVIMHGPLAASSHTWTHTHTHMHTPCPLSTDRSWHHISLKNSVDVLRQRKLATWRSTD